MMYPNIKRTVNIEILWLIGVILFFVITNIIWLAIDTVPPSWDDSIHMKLSILHARLIPQVRTISDLKEVISLSSYYPPFFHISALPILYLSGFNEDYMVYLNFLYLVVLVFSVYGIGKILFNARVGILSALLTLLYPAMYALSRRYMLDFALVSVVSMVYYSILKFEREKSMGWAVLLLIAMIIATLTKQTAPIFFIPAVIFIIWNIRHEKNHFFLVFSGIFASSFLIVARYYNKIIDLLLRDFIFNFKSSFVKMSWYVEGIGTCLTSTYLGLFLLIGGALFFIFHKRRKDFFFLLSWIAGAFFIIIFISWRDARYIMPILPALALITIGGIDSLREKFIKNIFLGIIICTGFMLFIDLSFNPALFLVKKGSFFYNRSPLRQNWNIREILAYITKRFKGKTIKIGIFPNCEYFNHDEFILYITLNKLPYVIESLFLNEPFGKNINDCDIVITKFPFTSQYCQNTEEVKSYEEMIEEMLKKSSFKNIKSFDLPDNSKAAVYQRY